MLRIDFRKEVAGFCLDVAFTCPQGVTALVGPSGCGKSLTLRCLAGLLKPDQGRISLGERVFFDRDRKINLPPQQRRIGYLFQNYALFPHLTVAQNIAYGIQDRPIQDRQRRTAQLLRLLRLEGLEGRYPHRLSGGQQQRVALARALAGEPDLLILDEPFSALDGAVRGKLRQELKTILKDLAITTLFVSHDLEEAYSFGDQIAVFEGGKVLQYGDKEEVLRRPVSRKVARLLGAKNFLDGVVAGRHSHGLEVAIGDRLILKTPLFPWIIGERVTAIIRPHDIILATEDSLAGAGQDVNLVRGWMAGIIPYPDRYTVFVKLFAEPRHPGDYDLQLEVARPTFHAMELAMDRPVTLEIPREALYILAS